MYDARLDMLYFAQMMAAAGSSRMTAGGSQPTLLPHGYSAMPMLVSQYSMAMRVEDGSSYDDGQMMY
jgi:hypothetical protein